MGSSAWDSWEDGEKGCHTPLLYIFIFKIVVNCSGWCAQLVDCCPMHWKVAGSMPGQDVGLNPGQGGYSSDRCFSHILMFLRPPFSKIINENIFLKTVVNYT